MINRPTTTVTVLGGVSADNGWGDETEGAEPVFVKIPAAIHLQPRQSTSDEGQREPVTILFFTGYLPNRYNGLVTGSHRIRDERTNEVYMIDTVTCPQHPGAPQDVRLDLRRVS